MRNTYLEMNVNEFERLLETLTIKKIGEIANELGTSVNLKTKKTTVIEKLLIKYKEIKEEFENNNIEVIEENNEEFKKHLQLINNMQIKLNEINIKINQNEYFKDDIKRHDSIVITSEDNFEVVYNKNGSNFELKTTYSNQLLTEEYMRKLNSILNVLNNRSNPMPVTTGKYGIGTMHKIVKGTLTIKDVYFDGNIEMVEYELNGKILKNKKVNLVSNIIKFSKRAQQ